MANLRAPAESTFTRTTHVVIAVLLTCAALALTAVHVRSTAVLLNDLGRTLQTAPTVVAHRRTTWGHVLGDTTPLQTAMKCGNTPTCAKWLNKSLNMQGHFDLLNYGVMGLLLASAVAWGRVPSAQIRKDPGQGRWASLTDPRIDELVDLPPRTAKKRKLYARMNRSNPRSLYMGHFIPGTPHGFLWNQPRLALLRERDRHENVMVMGAPGSGKTRGVFRQNIALDAVHGRTAIVYDLKWPQMDSGFGDLALYFHKLGRPVYVFAPFSPTSMRLPLLDNIDTLDEALKLARAIIAPPEHGKESGEHYKDNERRTLAAMILAIAQSPTPTMKELQRLGQMNAAEITDWYKRQVNTEIRQALKAMFDKRSDQISDTLAGVLNKLQIFYNDEVSRATTAGSNPAELIDTRSLITNGGLLIIGIPSKHIMSGEGEILLQLIKRRIDRDLLDIADESKGGRLPVTATYYLDELPGLGRLPHLDKNLSQWRSKNICMMLGVQNSEHPALVYTQEYWDAMTTSNVGTRLYFVRGMTLIDAENLSKEVGETTVDREGLTRSGHALFSSPWSTEARKGTSQKIESAPLLSPEEIKRFPRDLAVVFAKGQNPALVATPSLDMPYITLSTPNGREVKIKNQLHDHWKRVMKGASIEEIEEEAKAFIATLGVNTAPGAPVEKVKSAPEYWMEWIGALLDEGALARTQKTDDKVKIMIRRDSLPPSLSAERDLDYFIGCGWLNVSQNEEELTITQFGLQTAGHVLKASLRDFIVRGPALYWARTHMNEVNGYPGGATSGGTARYTPETLSIPPAVAVELYNVLPDLPLIEENGQTLVQIPLSDPTALSEAVSRARAKAGKQSLPVLDITDPGENELARPSPADVTPAEAPVTPSAAAEPSTAQPLTPTPKDPVLESAPSEDDEHGQMLKQEDRNEIAKNFF